MNKWVFGNFFSFVRLLDDSYVKELRLVRFTFFKEFFVIFDLVEIELRFEV